MARIPLNPPQAYFKMSHEGNNVTYSVLYVDQNGKLTSSNRRLIPIYEPLPDPKMSVGELSAASQLSLGIEADEYQYDPNARSLDELPFHVIQRIFHYLPEGKITEISAVSPVFAQVASYSMFKRALSFHPVIVRELRRLRRELRYIEVNDENSSDVIPLYRSYYMLETLKSESSVFLAFCRHLVSSRSKVITLGPYFEIVSDLLRRAVLRDLPPMHPTEQLTFQMNRMAKSYIDKEWDFVCDNKMGTRIMDLLDAAIDKMYKITVKFVPQDNLCVIDAKYVLHNLQYINGPPMLANPESMVPNPDDKRKLFMFLHNVVKINNKITLRDEQYQREMEANHREANYLEIHLSIGIIFLPPPRALGAPVRNYFTIYPLTSRHRDVRNGKLEIHEKYISSQFEELLPLRVKGVGVFSIKLQCSISNAPYSILRCWRRLKSDLGATGLHLSYPQSSHEEENDENYLLSATFETRKQIQHRNVMQIEAIEFMEAANGKELAVPYVYTLLPE